MLCLVGMVVNQPFSLSSVHIIVLFVIFSVHICVNRIHWLHRPSEMPPFLVVRTVFLMQIQLRLCFKTQQWN